MQTFYKFTNSITLKSILTQHNIKLIGFILIATCIWHMAYALKGDDQKPVVIEANYATLDKKHMISVFTGNVVITQGSLNIYADKATATEDVHGNKNILLSGNPVHFTQMADDHEQVIGQANTLTYNTQTNLGVLNGRARVQKGHNLVIGNTITYNTQSEVYSVTSGFSNKNNHGNGRITVILSPNNKQTEL